MSTSHPTDPEFTPPAAKGRGGCSFTLVELLVILGILGVLVALLLPATRSAGGAAKRVQCASNLKEIGLALYNYETVYKVLPPAVTVDAKGRVLHSWRTLILPYVDNNELYKTIDLTKPWDDPVNARVRETPIPFYHCPSSRDPATTTTSLASCGADACLDPHTPRRLNEITDGQDKTLAVIEAGSAEAVPWMQPVDADAALLARIAADRNTHHPGGRNVLFVDGSVRFLGSILPASVLSQLRTIAGGEPIAPAEF